MSEGLLARLGRWCFRWRWLVLAAWLAAAVGGVLAAGPVFAGMEQGGAPEDVESIEAYDVLADGDEEGGRIVGLIDRVEPDAAPVRSAVTSTAVELAGITGVRQVSHPYDDDLTDPAPYLSRDGRALLVVVDLVKLDQGAELTNTIDDVTDRLDALDLRLSDAGQPAATVRLGGATMIDQEANIVVEEDLWRAEVIALPITLVVLVVVFGGLIAAGLPVLAAVVSVASAMTVLLGFATFTELNSNVVTVVTLLGLGLSVDYGLLLVARYREELASGHDPESAVGRAWATAGRTILFSALSIAAALGGLLLFELNDLAALGAAGISIALVAMVVGLTFTAALIGLLRRRVGPSRRARQRAERRAERSAERRAERWAKRRATAGTPGVTGHRVAGHRAGVAGRTPANVDETGFFAGLARMVQRQPLLVVLLTTVALLAAGAPLLSTALRLPDLEQMPQSMESVRVGDELVERFGRPADSGITVVARTDAGPLNAWAARWTGDPAVAAVDPARQAGPGLATVKIHVTGDPQGDAARALVERLRADRPAGVASWVTGDAAVLTDLIGMIRSGLPLALGVTLVAMFLLLFLFAGSFVVPIKAVLANVVSLGATFGVMNAVFERGFLAGPLDTITVGALDPFVIVIVFGFAFGLSMDYEVFLLGRIKEYVDAGLPTDAAVRRGLQHTGRVITSAALLMIIVFAGFGAAQMGQIEQIGLGLAVAVLIDATIVRCLLVPATMTLLGRWNWWAPRWAKRLHRRIGLHERALPPDGPGPTAATSTELVRVR
jgi:RND superfamily putative drug exporter